MRGVVRVRRKFVEGHIVAFKGGLLRGLNFVRGFRWGHALDDVRLGGSDHQNLARVPIVWSKMSCLRRTEFFAAVQLLESPRLYLAAIRIEPRDVNMHERALVPEHAQHIVGSRQLTRTLGGVGTCDLSHSNSNKNVSQGARWFVSLHDRNQRSRMRAHLEKEPFSGIFDRTRWPDPISPLLAAAEQCRIICSTQLHLASLPRQTSKFPLYYCVKVPQEPLDLIKLPIYASKL